MNAVPYLEDTFLFSFLSLVLLEAIVTSRTLTASPASLTMYKQNCAWQQSFTK